MVQGFDNIGVCVTNLQGSVAFYELLGLREAYRNERGVLMAAGDARLFLFATRRADPPPVGRQLGLLENPPGIDHISFAVADVDGVYAIKRSWREIRWGAAGSVLGRPHGRFEGS